MDIDKEKQELIDKYLIRIKIDFPENDKLCIDLQEFSRELFILFSSQNIN